MQVRRASEGWDSKNIICKKSHNHMKSFHDYSILLMQSNSFQEDNILTAIAENYIALNSSFPVLLF
jgi:hypothetical protein